MNKNVAKNEVKNVGKVMAEMATQAVNPVMVAVAPIVNPTKEEEVKAKDEPKEVEATKAEEAPKATEAKGKKKASKKSAEELQAELERKTAELQKCLEDLERK